MCFYFFALFFSKLTLWTNIARVTPQCRPEMWGKGQYQSQHNNLCCFKGLTRDIYSLYTSSCTEKSQPSNETKISLLGHVLLHLRGLLHSFRPFGQNMSQHSYFRFFSGLTFWEDQGGFKDYISRVSPLWQQKLVCQD